MANLFNRAGHASTTVGAGTVTLGSALGAVSPNICSFESFSSAGVQDQNIVSYLILDANGAWELGWGIYTASGTTLTRNLTKSSTGSLLALSGSEQVFIATRAEDMATVEALAAANIAINGATDISQENGSNSVALSTGVAKYIVDQWQAEFVSASLVMAAQQVTPPGSPPFGTAFANAVQLKTTTGAALGAGDFAVYLHSIEGYRWARLGYGAAGAQATTIGFWVYATIAGTMTVAVRNSAANRTYLANVTINSPTTWEWHTVVIPGDTIGTWGNTNGVGATLVFCCGTGATFQGTNAAWNAGNFLGTPSTTNFFASNLNLVAITGLVVLPGAHQLSQEQSPFLQRSVDIELQMCERYFRVIGGNTSARYGPARTTSTTNGELIFPLVYPMRAAPTVTVNSIANWLVNDASVNAAASAVASTITAPDAVNVNLTCAAVTAFRPAFFNSNTTAATMFFDARM